MILIINTAEADLIKIILAQSPDNFKVKKIKAAGKQSEKLLAALSDFLAIQKAPLRKLRGLGVVTGPGSFTSLRIGVVVANALAYSLNIPVSGLKLSEFTNDDDLVKKMWQRFKKQKRVEWVVPFYGREPNITKSRS